MMMSLRLRTVLLLLLVFVVVVVVAEDDDEHYAAVSSCADKITIPKVAFLDDSIDSSEEYSYYYEVCIDQDALLCTGRVHMTSEWETRTIIEKNDDDETASYSSYGTEVHRDKVYGDTIDLTIPSPSSLGFSTEYYRTTAQRIAVFIGVDNLQNDDDDYEYPIVWFFKMNTDFVCSRPNGENCDPFCCSMTFTRHDMAVHSIIMDRGKYVTLVLESPLTRFLRWLKVGLFALIIALFITRRLPASSTTDMDYGRHDEASERQID